MEDKSILEVILTRNYKYWTQKYNAANRGHDVQGFFWDLDNPYAWDLQGTTVDIPPHFWGREKTTQMRIRFEFDWTKHVGPAHAYAPRPTTSTGGRSRDGCGQRAWRRWSRAATAAAGVARSAPACLASCLASLQSLVTLSGGEVT